MIWRSLLLALYTAAILGCGAPVITAQQVIDRYKAAGLEVENPHPPKFEEGSPFPRSFSDGISFDLPSLKTADADEPPHGAVLICATKKNCDAIYTYLDALKGLLGPYYYQSKSGTVVASLDSTMPSDIAAKYEAIINALP